MTQTRDRVFIDVISHIWWPQEPTCAYSYVAKHRDNPQFADELRLTGRPDEDRETIADWLSTNSGDFSIITDFSAYLPDGSMLDWANGEESATAFYEATC